MLFVSGLTSENLLPNDGIAENILTNIVGMVAAMTESEPGVASEKASYSTLG
jgi:hypothetical protein